MMCSIASVMMAVLPVLASEIKSDEVVVFYPTYAHWAEGGKTWTILVHGVIFEPEEDSVKRALAVAALRRRIGVRRGTPESAIFDRRVRLFLVDHERGKDIWIRLGPRVCRVGRSRPNGHFSARLQLGAADVDRLLASRQAQGDWISFRAVTRRGDNRRFVGRVQLIGGLGLSVISDIDDTIKHTQVGDRRAMLRNTLLCDFRAVSGMAELYRRWAAQGVVFHYVSGSPWQLYRPLSDFFRSEGFPAGSFHLKHFRLTDATAFNLLRSQEKTKLGAIEPILAAFPHRRFVLVGDSGEQDPEIYGRVARRHGEQIAAILIRNVTGEAADGERFRRAFEGVGQQRWELFRRPEELEGLLGKLNQSQETAR